MNGDYRPVTLAHLSAVAFALEAIPDGTELRDVPRAVEDWLICAGMPNEVVRFGRALALGLAKSSTRIPQ